jgi:hypothetical protein
VSTGGLPDYLGPLTGTYAGDAIPVGRLEDPSLEQIAALKPDLIVSAKVRHEALVRREALETEGGVRPPRRAVAAVWWELSAVRSGRRR